MLIKSYLLNSLLQMVWLRLIADHNIILQLKVMFPFCCHLKTDGWSNFTK